MPKIFISYRREDSQWPARSLRDALIPHVRDPRTDIFMDIDNIPLGVNFADHIGAQVAECDVLLALVGPNWISLTDESGQSRLNNPKDFVRLEIGQALKRGIPVVPVLLDGARMPGVGQLPEDLRELAMRHATEIRHATFTADAERLIRGLGLAKATNKPGGSPPTHQTPVKTSDANSSAAKRAWLWPAGLVAILVVAVVAAGASGPFGNRQGPSRVSDTVTPADSFIENSIVFHHNPVANAGAPADGTPFSDAPENPAVDTGDDRQLESADTGLPLSPLPNLNAPTMYERQADLGQPSFYYFRPGVLAPRSGTGSTEMAVLVPDMLFPIKDAPAIAQSQFYRWGGSIKGGDQCDTRNFLAPWRDNFCESRPTAATTPWCTKTGVHLGQDIRVGSPEGCRAERATRSTDRVRYEVVAAEDGLVSNVGSYSITLRAGSGGRIYRYLHLNMAKLKVATNQAVKKGDVLGYVSNDFGGTPTTLHLHFEIKLNTASHGWQYVPPYSSLLEAYKRRESNDGEQVADDFVVASTPR